MALNVVVGTVVPFAGDVTDAATGDALKAQGWLGCLGQSLDTREYVALFNVVGYIYGGAGNMFQLPDLRGLFVTGATDDQPVGHVVRRSTTAAPKAAFGTSTDGNHNHTLNYVPGEHYTSDYCAGHHVTAWNAGSTAIDRAGTHGHSFNSGGDHETRPINLALDFIIRFQGA
jgi:microcystin-dependent protein